MEQVNLTRGIRPPRWSCEELDYLQSIARSDEFSALAANFRREAAARGWPERNDTAIKVRLKRLKISLKPLDGGWTCTGLAEILGISRDRVHDWVERGLLKSSRKPGKRHHRILLQNFIAFAKAHPEWLTDIDRSGLEYLLPDSIVGTILNQQPRTRGIRFTVRTNNGKIYPSLRAAARGEFFTKGHIKEVAVSGRKTLSGAQFEILKRG